MKKLMRLFSLPPFLRRHPRDGMAAPDNRRTGQKEFSKRADQREKSLRSVLAALLPAYIALFAAISSGIYALAYEVASPEFTWKIWFVLLAAVSFSYISRCGKRSVQRLYGWLMVLVIIALPLLAIRGHSFSLVPTDSVADSNTVVAVLMGWLAIASVFLVGARYGSSPVPFTAPLVPTISLFGLLNSISVNTVVSVSFLTFVIASLYLVAYERMLNQEHILDVLGQGTHSQGAVGGQDQAAAPGAAFAGAPANAVLPAHVAPNQMRRTALHYLVACAVWFGICVTGATVIYYPLQAVLPTTLARNLTGVGVSARRVGDWRNPAPVMEMSGGNHALSDREMLRVTINRGRSTGLWRGRVYERYAAGSAGSYWEQARGWVRGRRSATVRRSNIPIFSVTIYEDGYVKLPRSQQRIAPGVAVRRLIDETIEPLNILTTTLHTSGAPIKVRGNLGNLWVRPDGTARIEDSTRSNEPYHVISEVIAPREAALENTPGLSATELEQWRGDSMTRMTLELPTVDNADERLREIARQIRARSLDRGKRLDTPFRKALAIGEYLETTCTYTLQVPTVPAGQDSTLFFLTQSRLGACDMFASAAALLLRAMDVPTRVATGFLQPAPEPEAFTADGTSSAAASASNSFVLRERDAHAWVEYYVPATGWLTYDATPPGQRPEPPLREKVLQFLHWNELLQQGRLFLLPAAGLILLLIGGAWTVLDMRRPRQAVVVTEADIERGRITSAYTEAVRILSRSVRRSAGQTAQDYEAAVSRSPLPSSVKLEFAALTHLFVAAHYARDAASPDDQVAETTATGNSPAASAPPLSGIDAGQLRECVQRLRQGLKQKPRR